MWTKIVARGVLAVALICIADASLAQDGRQTKPGETRVNGYNAIIDNVDLLVDNYARFMARKYTLSDDQDAFTKQLLRERAYAFLDKHENDLRDLFETLFQVRAGADIDSNGMADWAKKAGPLYEEAKKLIEQGNNDFREILNDDQKKIHDDDLKNMAESFATTEQTLHRMSAGEMTIDEFRNPHGDYSKKRQRPAPQAAEPPPPPQEQPQPEPTVVSQDSPDGGKVVQPVTENPGGATRVSKKELVKPPADPAEAEKAREIERQNEAARQKEAERKNQAHQPKEQPQPNEQPQPEAGQPAPPPAPAEPVNNPAVQPRAAKTPAAFGGKNYETEWEAYTRDFIAKYQLNEEQTQKAMTILKSCQDNAAKVAAGNKSEMEQLEKREAELRSSKDAAAKGKELGEITKRKEALTKPIGDIFETQLKPRLDRLPTRAQRKAADEAAKKAAPAKPAAAPTKPGDAKPGDKPAGGAKP